MLACCTHLFFQIALELLQKIGHIRVSFKVTKVIVNP